VAPRQYLKGMYVVWGARGGGGGGMEVGGLLKGGLVWVSLMSRSLSTRGLPAIEGVCEVVVLGPTRAIDLRRAGCIDVVLGHNERGVRPTRCVLAYNPTPLSSWSRPTRLWCVWRIPVDRRSSSHPLCVNFTYDLHTHSHTDTVTISSLPC